MTTSARKRVLAIVTDELSGEESIEQIRRETQDDGSELRVVVPAVEATAFRHTMGDVDLPREDAEERLQVVLRHLREHGIQASGDVGDPDPVQAAQDALLREPADEVLIFEHSGAQSRWFEDGLFERARESLEPPLRLVAVEHDDGDDVDHVVDVETTPAGTQEEAEREIGGSYFPGLSPGDLGGIVAGIVGTVLVAVLAGVVAASDGNNGAEPAAILIAIGTALINMAHVVGLTLFESVRYRGGFAKLFRTLSLIVTPSAVIVNAILAVAG